MSCLLESHGLDVRGSGAFRYVSRRHARREDDREHWARSKLQNRRRQNGSTVDIEWRQGITRKGLAHTNRSGPG